MTAELKTKKMNDKLWNIRAIRLLEELAIRKIDLIKVVTTLDPLLNVLEINEHTIKRRVFYNDEEAYDLMNTFDYCYQKLDWSDIKEETLKYVTSYITRLIKEETKTNNDLPF